MSASDSKSETIEVVCPQCKRVVKLTVAEADKKMKVTCPNGHEIPLVKMM